MPEVPTQSERFQGCLLGLMLGDCLGFSFDGSPTADTAVHDTAAQVESPVFLVPGVISRDQTLFSVLVIVSTILAARFRSWRHCAKCFSARRIRLLTLSGWFKPNGAARSRSVAVV